MIQAVTPGGGHTLTTRAPVNWPIATIDFFKCFLELFSGSLQHKAYMKLHPFHELFRTSLQMMRLRMCWILSAAKILRREMLFIRKFTFNTCRRMVFNNFLNKVTFLNDWSVLWLIWETEMTAYVMFVLYLC